MISRGAYGKSNAEAIPPTLGGRIRCVRIAWGWTQGELAERLLTDQQHVSMWERNRAKPSRTVLALLAQFLGLDVDALLTGKGFAIPDVPELLSSPRREVRTITLPPMEDGMAWVLSTKGHAAPGAMTAKEAILLARSLAKKGKGFWLVYEEDADLVGG